MIPAAENQRVRRESQRREDTTPALVVVAALREELAPLVRRLGEVERIVAGGRLHLRARLGEVPLVLTWTGEGVRNAELGVRAVLPLAPGVPLVGVGVAGALSPGLRAGELVIGETVREGADSFVAAADWVERARRAGVRRTGIVTTVDEVITSPERKRALWEGLGRPEVGVVDMESARLAYIAGAEGRPFLVVRAISDEADEGLPPYLELCRDASGALDRGRVLGWLARRPSSLPTLLRLRRRVSICAVSLAELMVRLVAGTLPGVAAPYLAKLGEVS